MWNVPANSCEASAMIMYPVAHREKASTRLIRSAPGRWRRHERRDDADLATTMTPSRRPCTPAWTAPPVHPPPPCGRVDEGGDRVGPSMASGSTRAAELRRLAHGAAEQEDRHHGERRAESTPAARPEHPRVLQRARRGPHDEQAMAMPKSRARGDEGFLPACEALHFS